LRIKTLRIFAFVCTIKEGALQIFDLIGVDPFLELVKANFQDEIEPSSVKNVDLDSLQKTRYLMSIVSSIVNVLDAEKIKSTWYGNFLEISER
jgi:hypothetical protein